MTAEYDEFGERLPEVTDVRFLRAYCSSKMCSNGIKLALKAVVWLNNTRQNPENIYYYGKPIDCQDCSSVLYWKRVPHGSLHDPIYDPTLN